MILNFGERGGGVGGGVSFCEGVFFGIEFKFLVFNSIGCFSFFVLLIRLFFDFVERIGLLCIVDGFFNFYGLWKLLKSLWVFEKSKLVVWLRKLLGLGVLV